MNLFLLLSSAQQDATTTTAQTENTTGTDIMHAVPNSSAGQGIIVGLRLVGLTIKAQIHPLSGTLVRQCLTLSVAVETDRL